MRKRLATNFKEWLMLRIYIICREGYFVGMYQSLPAMMLSTIILGLLNLHCLLLIPVRLFFLTEGLRMVYHDL